MSGVRRLIKFVGVSLAVVLMLGGLAQSSVADEGYDELERFPGQGIPVPAGVTGAWITPQQSALAYLKRARQWTRTPTLQSVAFNRDTQKFVDYLCQGRIRQAPGAKEYREYVNDIVFVDTSKPLNSPRRYGSTQSFTVRAVAFGGVPVEATVRLEQPRNSKGVVVPATVKIANILYCPGQGDFDIPPPDSTVAWRAPPAQGEGRVNLRIDRLKVDGVTLPVTGCAAHDATYRLTSRDYLNWAVPDDERIDPSKESILRAKYFSIGGGLLLGSLDIPAFSGCVTRNGEDISTLLTATVSGEGNTIQIRSESLGDKKAGSEDEFDACPFIGNCADRFPVPELPTAPPS